MSNCDYNMSQNNLEEITYEDDKPSTSVNNVDEKDINDIITCEDAKESSLLNSIVEAVMRGDMNQVVTLALSHRNTDPRDKRIVDEALSTALRNKLKCDQNKELETDLESDSKANVFDREEDVTAIELNEISESKRESAVDLLGSNCLYSTTLKSNDNSDIQCSYYIDSSSIIESSNNITYCQPGFQNQNMALENHSEDHVNGNFSHYHTTSSIHHLDNMHSMNSSQQSVQVQLPGIGNFLLQIPSNLKPGEPITLPINLPLTPVSQTSGVNPISINMSTGQLISNQLLSLYNPSSNMNNITIGKKMRAIAPKPSKPAYRQPLIAPKTSSPTTSSFNQECSSTANSTPLPAPSGPGRRKGTKGKKVGRKRGAPPKSRKDSSYASSTHSIDSQDATQFSETNNTLKQNSNNFTNSRNTYQCNYYVNSDSSDYINHSHVPQSYNELHTSNLIDTSDSGEKDLLSLAWEISNAELGNNDDFTATYQLYDTNNLTSEGFVSSEILDQFLQNIQKDDLSELTRCSSNQVNLDSRVSYASSFTTLPPCSTVLPSVTTSSYLNNSSADQSNLELSQCIEIAEVVNLNTEDMLSELEKEENALLDKFVAQYSSNATDSLKCDTQMYTSINSLSTIDVKYIDNDTKIHSENPKVDDSEKDMDPNTKDSNELSEIAQQIEKDCDESNINNSSESKIFMSQHSFGYQNSVDNVNQPSENCATVDDGDAFNLQSSGHFCRIVTTPLELMYSTATDSFNSMVDVQNHYLMSVNIDDKKQREPTFYIADGSLQSKTLDDFGLFDFCTDNGVHQDSEAVSLDEKKYLEPPILEDISDATPIPSDEESEDDDIDLCAFKLSTSNYFNLLSNKKYQIDPRHITDVLYTSTKNDLHTFVDTAHIERHSDASDKWYIYDTLIKDDDAFSIRQPIEKNTDISFPDVDINKKVENDVKEGYDQNMLKSSPVKCREIKKLKSIPTAKTFESTYHKDRQSRLRKPPVKLAIYHSIKFIEKVISTKSTEELQSNKILDSDISKKETDNSLKSKHNSKINHCTRSKGSISKSYDSFYETLEKTHRQQNPKIRKRQKKNLEVISVPSNLNSLKNLNSEIVETNCTNEFKLSTILNKEKIESSEKGIKVARNVSCVLEKNKIKNSSKVLRKYNLRKNDLLENNKITGRSFTKMVHDKKTKNISTTNNSLMRKSRIPKKHHSCNTKNKISIKENNKTLTESEKVETAEIVKIDNIFYMLTDVDFVVEHEMKIKENNSYDLCTAVIKSVNLYKCTVSEISGIDINVGTDTNKLGNCPKTSCPVRKINKKLRLLSGLESNKIIYYSTIVDNEEFDYPFEYSLDAQIVKFSVYNHSLIRYSECNLSSVEVKESKSEYQNFDVSEEDFDDGDSCDARLVIVENEDILNPSIINKCNVNDADNLIDSANIQLEICDNKKILESKAADLPKRYSLRNKSKVVNSLTNDNLDTGSISPIPSNLRRQSLRRSCKKIEMINKEITQKEVSNDIENAFNNFSLKNPICSIEKLTNDDLLATLNDNTFPKYSLDASVNDPFEQNKSNYIAKETMLPCNNDDVDKIIQNPTIIFPEKNEIISRIHTRIKKNKPILKLYQNRLKSLWKVKVNKKLNNSLKLKNKFQSNIKENLTLIENGIAKINFETNDMNPSSVDNENDSIEIDDDIHEDRLCTFVDSNNVETFSRSYGSFSLKIKFQKQDPIIVEENKEQTKRQKRHSKKRKRLRNFLNSIIGSKNFEGEDSNSGYESVNEETENKSKHNRKRKHSNIDNGSIGSSNQENIIQNNDIPPKLTPESTINEDEHQKPIKIKLFKASRDDFSKSEEMIFSLQKSNLDDKKDNNKSSIPKMLQVLKEQPSKPCRQAANLAKKKIFSTAKEDRRSQNATLTSIWNPRKVNNILNKLPSDFINSYNDRGRRPRGRPPKSTHTSLLFEKQTSSTGTLKLKIRLSKDFKNCNDDCISSTGEISGRTSTNDSSILNSAVAGINGPSDVLSLESNNFINGITQQLDENIEYLEAKDAKVYFDPHQVDIEKIKNSYYSSKKNSSMHFDNESQQNLYDSAPELCNKKDALTSNQDFSQFNDNESSTPYNNNSLSKDYPSNNKISHMPKDLINISENCYNSLSTNREPQDLSQSNQSYSFENHISSPGKNQTELWQSTKSNSNELLSPCRNGNNAWFSEHRPFPNSNSILYDSYLNSNIKDTKNCATQNQNQPFILCENESSDSKHVQISPSKRSSSKEGRKSSNNSFESHSQLSPSYPRGGGIVPSQLTLNPWSDETNHNTSLNHTAAAWMTYAQQQAAAAAYMDPQMKAYYNLALSQSMLNNPYCGSYSNPTGNPENFYSSLHSQYLNNSKDLNEKNSTTIRNHNDPMGTFMEAAQMSSWEHFYSAAAMAGYHNSSQGTMDDYTGRAGNMLQTRHMLAGGYPGSVLTRDHFPLDGNKPPLAHQNQSESTSPMKQMSSPTPISSAQAYPHVQMPYNHFNGTPVGFF